MINENHLIAYPSIFAGTEKSEINFCNSVSDLCTVFNLSDKDSQKLPRYFFITDATVASLECMKPFISQFDDGVCGKNNLIILGSGEPYKTIESVLSIISEAFEADYSRNDIFVGIGGGVICDLTAFAASIYKRGIEVQLIPTTLLAMVDAAIGGKTGCDYENAKNLIGTFHPASKLYYFTEFIQSLPENQFNSGLAEAFKTALLYDNSLYQLFKNESEKINSRDSELLDKIIKKCVAAKGQVVQKDFTEKNSRTLLNLGHTFAHGLENVAGLGAVTHGYAVAWGIGRAVELAYRKDYCLQAFKDEIFETLKLYGWETEPIPSIVRGGGIGERFISVMHKDKKVISDKIRLVILKGFQDAIVEEIDDSDILAVFKS